MVIKNPGDFFSGIKDRIPKEQRLSFLSTFIIGFFTHLFILTNSMYNGDDIRYLYVTFDKPELGRWLQTYAAGISSYYSLPVVNGLLALIYAGTAAMIITKIFNVKSRINIILIGGILVTFPTMACLFGFNFAVDPFLLSCAMACLAAYFVTRGKYRFSWLIGAVIFCVSVAIYQAYMPFTLLLMLLYYLLMLADTKVSDKELIKKGIDYILMLVCGMGMYYVGMEATLKIKDISLSDYQGVGESSFPGPVQLIERMKRALTDFVDFFKGNQVLALNGWLKAGLIITIVIIIAAYLVLIVNSRLYKSPLRVLLLIFTGACIPFGVGVIWLISDGVNYHILMRHSWCLMFAAALVLIERAGPLLSSNKSAVMSWAGFLAVSLVIWNYIILSNIGYFNMNFRYEKTYALCLKIVSRLEEMEDYDYGRPMAFVGRYSRTYEMEETAILLDPMHGMKGATVFGEGSRCFLPFMQNCLGENIEVVSRERENEFHTDPRFIEMPRFPDKGSIKVIDGITVIKLND